jgi:uncharacterized membrane protein
MYVHAFDHPVRNFTTPRANHARSRGAPRGARVAACSRMTKLLALSLLAFAACTGTPSGATCPTTAAPDYVTFGKPFFDKYCSDCHSSISPNRHGAPTDQNFDTEADIKAHAADIDEVAAKGPGADNTSMPDMSGAVHSPPTDAEREMLGQFLACEGK